MRMRIRFHCSECVSCGYRQCDILSVVVAMAILANRGRTFLALWSLRMPCVRNTAPLRLCLNANSRVRPRMAECTISELGDRKAVHLFRW